jgi:hypothetical protein
MYAYIYIHTHIHTNKHIELQARLVELLRINIVTRADVSEEALPTGTKNKTKKYYYY